MIRSLQLTCRLAIWGCCALLSMPTVGAEPLPAELERALDLIAHRAAVQAYRVDASVNENSDGGTLIGTLSGFDADGGGLQA